MSKLTRYKLSELYSISSGISSKPEQAGHGYPFCSFSTVFNNTFLPDELPDLMDTSEQERSFYSILKGDVFLTRTSETVEELGMSSVAVKDYPNATYSGFLKRLRPISDKAYPQYMALLFRSHYFRKTVTNKAVMTLRASFNEDTFNDIYLYLPPLEEQIKIGDLFFNIERHIRNNNATCSDLENMAKLIYDYWFVQFDFPDENGKPYKSSGGKMVWNSDLNREIPKGWEVKPVLEVFDWVGTSQPPKSTFIYAPKEGYIRFIQNRDYDGDQHLTFIPLTDNVKTCTELDIMMDKYGDAGKTRFGIAGAYNVALSKIVVRNASMREYVRAYLSSKSIYKYLNSACIASTRASLNEANFDFLSMPIPTEDILHRFNNVANLIIDQLLEIKRENQQLASLRDFLLPMLMNGQVKVAS